MVGSANSSVSVATHSDRELDKFIYHISHDLRASMRALVLVPSWIEEDLREELGGVPASIQEHVKLLTDQAQRLDAMMKDLLLYSRIGRMQTEGVMDLKAALAQVLDEFELPPDFKLEQNLAITELYGWPEDIKMLFRQLISNVLKHAKTNARLKTAKTNGGITLTLRDEGPGIDPKQHDRIFEMMTTLKPRDQVEGSGLGLAIARKIMAQHGGTLDVISDGKGNGTEFVAFFPDRSA